MKNQHGHERHRMYLRVFVLFVDEHWCRNNEGTHTLIICTHNMRVIRLTPRSRLHEGTPGGSSSAELQTGVFATTTIGFTSSVCATCWMVLEPNPTQIMTLACCCRGPESLRVRVRFSYFGRWLLLIWWLMKSLVVGRFHFPTVSSLVGSFSFSNCRLFVFSTIISSSGTSITCPSLLHQVPSNLLVLSPRTYQMSQYQLLQYNTL